MSRNLYHFNRQTSGVTSKCHQGENIFFPPVSVPHPGDVLRVNRTSGIEPDRPPPRAGYRTAMLRTFQTHMWIVDKECNSHGRDAQMSVLQFSIRIHKLPTCSYHPNVRPAIIHMSNSFDVVSSSLSWLAGHVKHAKTAYFAPIPM